MILISVTIAVVGGALEAWSIHKKNKKQQSYGMPPHLRSSIDVMNARSNRRD